VGATPAGAAPTLSWSTAKIDSTALTGISCASNTLCVAIDGEGHALISTNPGAGSGATWNQADIDPGRALSSVSCVSNTLCVAVDRSGNALLSTNPTNPASWSAPLPIDKGQVLNSVSCASNTLFCVAVDQVGNALVTTNPGATWNRAEIDPGGHALNSVSCASGSLCVAVDDAGRALVSSEPAANSWRTRALAAGGIGSGLTSVSCVSAPANVCVAVDETGDILASGDPTAPGPPTASGPTWNATPVDAFGKPMSVSCSASGLCVSVDSVGDGFVGDDPTAAAPSWTFAGIEPGPEALSGVSCVSEGLCAAVDANGHVLVAQVPPPAASTGAPSAIGETSATLTGTVNPQDATLADCHFEYGPSEAYGHSAPCGMGGAQGISGGATQGVSAALSGLVANTTYHYQLVVSGASGTERTLDATFKTSTPPLAQPHPSIGGIPARGQRLTCKSGVTVSGATLAYAWLRDTKVIAGANSSAYLVGSADVSHHLQCRVTATNTAGSATVTSSFVSVPAGGLGSISETQVGTPRASGSSVSVPLTCSAQAAGSCTIALRLTVVETLRGSHILAVAAQRTRHATVTIGASTVHLPAGQRRTVTLALNATGRRLLRHLRRLTAKLTVSGTVVGAISAQLRSATVTLGGAGKASSRKGSSGKKASRKASTHRASSRKTASRKASTHRTFSGKTASRIVRAGGVSALKASSRAVR
jgi:hypothetical protein